MKRTKLKEYEILNGGTIELFSVDNFYYVKATVGDVIKFSSPVCKFKVDIYVFIARRYGWLIF